MNKALFDKLFFFSHVDADYFVDYGCSSGDMLKTISNLTNKKAILAGYDIDQKMIELSSNKFIPNCFITDQWEAIVKDIEIAKNHNKKSCLILSSVIHEIYSYLDEDGINEFWNRVFESGFDYIVIRDMALKFDARSEKNALSPFHVDNIYNYADSCQVKDFEEIWGKLSLRNNAIHFLMKYRYTDNWEREVREDYFPLSFGRIEEIKFLHPKGRKYERTYSDHFQLPFLKKKVLEDFKFHLDIKTHYKYILEKND